MGAGFVGSSLAKHLSISHHVTTLDVNPAPPLLKDVRNIEHKTCDIRRYDQLKAKIGKPDVVIHTAIIQIPAINDMKERAYEVNIVGTQNVCRAVRETPEISGLILSGSWHVFGERDYRGTIDTTFGYRPDKVEERARLYVISKMMQEGIVRFFADIANEKTYGIIRLGTVLGENMPEKTAANIFVTNGLQGKPLTPFKHTMYRPMLYISIDDVCKVFQTYIEKMIRERSSDEISNSGVFNLFYPKPMTILELAKTVKKAIIKCTDGKTVPKLEIVETGAPPLHKADEKSTLRVDIQKTLSFFGIEKLKNPAEAIFEIVAQRARLLENS